MIVVLATPIFRPEAAFFAPSITNAKEPHPKIKIQITPIRFMLTPLITADSPSVATKAREGQPKTASELKRDYTLDLVGRGVPVAALGKRKGHAHEALASS